MVQIALISDNNETEKEINVLFHKYSYECEIIRNEAEADEFVRDKTAGVIIFDADSKNIDIISLIRKVKLTMQTNDIRSIVLLPEKNINYDILKYFNSYITRPVNDELFAAAINSNLQLCETFRVLSKNNNELAKSLYQLNVLYNTSTQIAGSLDKTKLIEIMTDGLDQSLSLSLTYALFLNEVNDIKLIIKSLFPISQRLEDAIKLRALLNFKNLFSINPAPESINIIKTNKDQFGEHDLNIFSYDNLFAPINIKNKFYGVIEVFREQDFAPDDTKCFTTLIKQVSLPLESAILYEEIKDTNIKLEKLERLKSEFISIVSHELRTPLTSINSALDIILKGSAGEINDAAEKFLNLAKRNVTRLSAIIYDLLDLSKIEAGKMEFRFEKSNINLTMEIVKNTLENLAKEQNITMELKADNTLGLVYVDSQRMEQVLTNLISNAIKFTKENGKIEIESKKITKSDLINNPFFEKLPDYMSEEYVQISVKDDGIGIAKENWNKVFEQFKQIENSLSRKVGGSGLGLPIAKRLMDAHKGFIWLNSEINKGSTFYIALPLMNDKEIFIHSLEQDMQKAKQDHINIALTSLRENVIEGKSFIDKILSDEIIRKNVVHKEYSYIENGKRYYYMYSVDVDSFVFDFEVKRVESYLNTNSAEYKECDIVYLSALYPRDTENKEEFLNKVSEFSKGDMNEENINS